MNKHSNHVDYICTKARNAMGWSALQYFGKYSIRQSFSSLLENLICGWHNFKMYRNHKQAYAEKCRQVAIRLIERNGGLTRTLAALKKNDTFKAWQAFNKERASI